MSRVLHTLLWSGFPFPCGIAGSAWDGSFVEIGRNASPDMPYLAPPRFAVGAGTLYPIGMASDMAAKLYKRVKSWHVHSEFTNDGDLFTNDDVQDAGVYVQGVTPFSNSNELDLARLRITPPDEFNALAGGTFLSAQAGTSSFNTAGLWLFAPNYSKVSNALQWEYPGSPDPIPYTGFMSSFSGSYQRHRVLRSGTTYYPMIHHIGIGSAFEGEDALRAVCCGAQMRSGSPESTSGGNASITFDGDTCTFTLTGSGTATPSISDDPTQTPVSVSYEVTCYPEEYWSYDGKYDTATGLPL